jgi:hypothetical protein
MELESIIDRMIGDILKSQMVAGSDFLSYFL